MLTQEKTDDENKFVDFVLEKVGKSQLEKLLIECSIESINTSNEIRGTFYAIFEDTTYFSPFFHEHDDEKPYNESEYLRNHMSYLRAKILEKRPDLKTRICEEGKLVLFKNDKV